MWIKCSDGSAVNSDLVACFFVGQRTFSNATGAYTEEGATTSTQWSVFANFLNAMGPALILSVDSQQEGEDFVGELLHSIRGGLITFDPALTYAPAYVPVRAPDRPRFVVPPGLSMSGTSADLRARVVCTACDCTWAVHKRTRDAKPPLCPTRFSGADGVRGTAINSWSEQPCTNCPDTLGRHIPSKAGDPFCPRAVE